MEVDVPVSISLRVLDSSATSGATRSPTRRPQAAAAAAGASSSSASTQAAPSATLSGNAVASSSSRGHHASPLARSLRAIPPQGVAYLGLVAVLSLSLLTGELGNKLVILLACTTMVLACLVIFLRLLPLIHASRGAGPRRGAASSFLQGLQMRRLGTSGLALEERRLLSRGEVDIARLQLLLADRDFDGNDYELLRALDEEDGPGAFLHGLSMSEISRLPVHTLSYKDVDKKSKGHRSCPICLETYAAGDVVRTLPCLHNFHTACCDPWLERQATCPVCKFAVEF